MAPRIRRLLKFVGVRLDPARQDFIDKRLMIGSVWQLPTVWMRPKAALIPVYYSNQSTGNAEKLIC